MMEYKGYVAGVEYDDEAGILHGEIVNTHAVITFEATSVEELWREMTISVDDYLEWCAERGKAPEKPCSGHLLLHTSPQLHRAMTQAAAQERQSLSAWATRVLEQAVGCAESEASPLASSVG